MNIILIGYRGSGKTTLGKLLASELWKEFVDTDVEVCKRFGNESIAEIWREHGEGAWREAESEVVGEVCGRENHVIALGGGSLMVAEAREAVEKARDTVRVYLRCAPEELHRRISGDPGSADTRPGLTDANGGLEEVRRVLADREAVYDTVADKVFDVTDVTAAASVRYIVDRCL